MGNEYTTESALTELRERFPNERCRILTFDEFWPEGVGKGPSETSHSVTVQIGFFGNVQKFEAATLDEAMAHLNAWHSENSLCAQCSYGVDNAGLCVMDATHGGYQPQV